MIDANREREALQLEKYVSYLGLRQNLIRMEEIDASELTLEEREEFQRSLEEARDQLWQVDRWLDEMPLAIDPDVYRQGRTDGIEWASADSDEGDAVREFLRSFKLDVNHAVDVYEQIFLMVPELEYHGYSYARGFVEGAREIAVQ